MICITDEAVVDAPAVAHCHRHVAVKVKFGDAQSRPGGLPFSRRDGGVYDGSRRAQTPRIAYELIIFVPRVSSSAENSTPVQDILHP